MTQARVLYEISQESGIRSKHFSQRLNLDAGYLSRLIKRFEKAGLLKRAGRAAAADLDKRSASEVKAQLQRLTLSAQTRLTESMRTIRELREPPPGSLL